MQGIAAAAAVDSADYEQCVEVLLPCVQQLSRDPEAEIRGTAVKQLSGLGELIAAHPALVKAFAFTFGLARS